MPTRERYSDVTTVTAPEDFSIGGRPRRCVDLFGGLSIVMNVQMEAGRIAHEQRALVRTPQPG